MQNHTNKVKAHGRKKAECRGVEPVNPGTSENSRSAVADRQKKSPRLDCSNVESIVPNHLSSPPSGGGPLKIGKDAGEFESSASIAAALPRTFGTSDEDLSVELFQQVKRALPKSLIDPQGNHALAALYGISPRDTLEGLLATQMVAGHNLAMDLLKRAALAEQPAVVELNLNSATKLLRTFTLQMDALNRYRGKDSQHMVVGNVNVAGGGQAIVGSVTQRGLGKASTENDADTVA